MKFPTESNCSSVLKLSHFFTNNFAISIFNTSSPKFSTFFTKFSHPEGPKKKQNEKEISYDIWLGPYAKYESANMFVVVVGMVYP